MYGNSLIKEKLSALRSCALRMVWPLMLPLIIFLNFLDIFFRFDFTGQNVRTNENYFRKKHGNLIFKYELKRNG